MITDRRKAGPGSNRYIITTANKPESSQAPRHVSTEAREQTSLIGHDCWIGHGAVIRSEIRIGTGAVIGAGAIVTRDVPDYWIVTGVPAKPMRPRFTDSIIARLLALAWWESPHGALCAVLTDFGSLPAEDFLARYDG